MKKTSTKHRIGQEDRAGLSECRPILLDSGVILVGKNGRKIPNTPEFPTEQEAWKYLAEHYKTEDNDDDSTDNQEGDAGSWKNS